MRSCSVWSASSSSHVARSVSVARVRVGERHLQQRPLERQRRSELVRRVGDEPPLCLERGLEPGEQVVERVAERLELVVGARPARVAR